ncbi:HAD-IC family P-type ATPase [Patescibacteria group bacterium]|nr:HAD-IC family P-type ATPase [Patescibacteria group bacterium]
MNSPQQTSNPWSEDVSVLFTTLQTSVSGLSSIEATKRFKQYGKNIVGGRAKSSALRLLWNQCKNPLVLLLVVASGLSFFLGKMNEGFFVLAAIIINVALGFWQEYKADNAVQQLEHYLTQRSRIMRDGSAQSINAENIVPGDYILFRSGDRIPADVRIVSCTHLEVDESILTGESLPVEKSVAVVVQQTVLADRTNMLWGGTVITQGSAEGIVMATGQHTALGAIATLVEKQRDEKTPLEHSVMQFTKIISVVLVFVGVLIAFIGVKNGYPLNDMLLTSIAVIVSAVPESLPIALSVVLAIGAETLARKNAVVRKMAATETLGATSIILTDKTGTLTEGRLTFVAVDIPLGQNLESNSDTVLVEASLHADVAIGQSGFQGRPLDIALAQTIQSRPELKALSESYTVLERLAFNSADKYSGVLIKNSTSTRITLLGAPDILIQKTSLSVEQKNLLLAQIAELSATGERVLGSISMNVSSSENLETLSKMNTYEFSGLLRFRDPIRTSVPAAVARIMASRVRTIVVTGDHPGTASWVAREIGLLPSQPDMVVGKDSAPSHILTGAEVALLTDTELTEALRHTVVFARMTPEQKLRLVELLEALGEVVAVTGDGVNDAPALKAATIGVAMGSGTDVARASSDIVILDNNYESIVDAIFEGRGVLKKIRTVITYLMADSFDELLLVGGSIIMTLALPITAIQILFVKFFSDIFPTLAFTFEKIDSASVAQLDRKARLIDKTVAIFTFGRGVVSSALLFMLYIYLLRAGYDEAIVRTFTYASFASYMLFLAFSMRNLEESILTYNPFSNHYLTAGVFVGFVMIMMSVYIPFMNTFLGTTPLPLVWFLGVIGVGVTNFFLIELFKYFLHKKK